MLGKKNKLTREQFDTLLRQKHKKINTSCGIFSFNEKIQVGFHASIVISKKIVKKAHERNFAKRVYYGYLSKLTHIPFYGYIVISKEGYALLLSDKDKVKDIIYDFFEKYSKK